LNSFLFDYAIEFRNWIDFSEGDAGIYIRPVDLEFNALDETKINPNAKKHSCIRRRVKMYYKTFNRNMLIKVIKIAISSFLVICKKARKYLEHFSHSESENPSNLAKMIKKNFFSFPFLSILQFEKFN
jgi:hypothetical protein